MFFLFSFFFFGQKACKIPAVSYNIHKAVPFKTLNAVKRMVQLQKNYVYFKESPQGSNSTVNYFRENLISLPTTGMLMLIVVRV